MKNKGERNRRAAVGTPPIQAAQKLTEILDIPQSALPASAQIEISGNREAIIEGCQGILEYDENVIKLTTGRMNVRFAGRGLQIKVLTHDSAVIEGIINIIEFLT